MSPKITEETIDPDLLTDLVATIVDIFEQPPARDGPSTS